jgi:hypothetical protein
LTARVGTSPASPTGKPRCHPRLRIKSLNSLDFAQRPEIP